MNLTDDQKKYLVPASIGAVVFVLCDELLFKTKGKRGSSKPNQKTLLAAGASTLAGYFLYDKAEPATKADLDKYALPAGGAAVAFAAVNRFAGPAVLKGKDPRPYALGAAAVAAFFTNKELAPTSPVIGLLPVFEPSFEPPFEPPFVSEFEG